MTKRMLIDATHPEETRVVVLDGSRLEDYDVETSTKRQLKGNIYLAKVVRVEPSLQAAFVEYGGGRHGFLAFGEIHPDYYQIPVADRERLIAAQEAEARENQEEEDRAAAADAAAEDAPAASSVTQDALPSPAEIEAIADADSPDTVADAIENPADPADPAIEANIASASAQPLAIAADILTAPILTTPEPPPEPLATEPVAEHEAPQAVAPPEAANSFHHSEHAPDHVEAAELAPAVKHAQDLATPDLHAPDLHASDSVDADAPDDPATAAISEPDAPQAEVALPADASPTHASPTDTSITDPAHADQPDHAYTQDNEQPAIELATGETLPEDNEDRADRRPTPRFLRNYKIQEVIKRRQILLIQVVKEERGTKGAALTTYISLAGRFSVLMPNSPSGGGISRKITSAADRRRLKEVTSELDLPRGMGLIIRTAGAQRPKPEILRDCEYLMRLWDDIREQTMRSMAPALIYEEASLIKRAIRDVYSRDVEDIQVDGEVAWKAARDYMRMLMPAHAKKVQLWTDQSQKLFARYQVDAQLDAMLQPTVQLKSGGYLVINQTEALVAIDVNSGRSTRERNIEETAFRTNMEAADEAARQLRLRDLAGLIVIDFIDMERRGNNAAVEKRLKDALKDDRARIQLGSISQFGLMELSRQRLRPSLAETALVTCPTCGGTGHVRGTENAAIAVLRAIEEEGAKRRAAEIMVHVATPVAMYLFNHKRDRLAEIERRYGMFVTFAGDDSLRPPDLRIDRVRAPIPGFVPPALTHDMAAPARVIDDVDAAEQEEDDLEFEDDDDAEESAPAGISADGATDGAATAEDSDKRGKRRRRRRRGGRDRDGAPIAPDALAASDALASSDPAALDGGDVGDIDLAIVPDRTDDHVEGVPEAVAADPDAAPPTTAEGEEARARRRGRRGGRRRRRDEPAAPEISALGADQPDLVPMPYIGPTPADPFGGGGFDIFDVLEQVEQDNDRRPAPAPVAPPVAAPAVVEIMSRDDGPAPMDFAPAPAPIAAADRQAPAFGAPEIAGIAPLSEPPAAVPAPTESPALDTISVAPPEPASELELAPEPASEPEPREPEPTPDPEPVVAPPIVIGVDVAAPVQARRGWWRR